MVEEVKSGFVAHLIELRDRLIKSLLSILVIFIAIVYFANDIYAFVAQPLVSHLPSTATMIATDVTPLLRWPDHRRIAFAEVLPRLPRPVASSAIAIRLCLFRPFASQL